MITKKAVIYISILVASFFSANSQNNYLRSLSYNPIVMKKWDDSKKLTIYYKKNAISDTLALPFIDDFSKPTVFPDASLWLDSSVFINNTFPKAPITVGVATFDGLSKYGLPYNWNANQKSSEWCDTLTSKNIDLAYNASDSIYFSFFYQAQGISINSPEPKDSLVLQFKSPTKNWTSVWNNKGYTLGSKDSAFHFVIIGITDTSYLKKGFQFRFKNYATPLGSLDQWNIDYVYLNKQRTRIDSVFSDVAFAFEAPSMLKNYQAMPWEQYVASEMDTSIYIKMVNIDTIAKNTFYDFNVYANDGSLFYNYAQGGSENVPPYSKFGYNNFPQQANPRFNFSYPLLSDTNTFTVEHVLNTSPDFNRWNDTLTFEQKFYDYFAYDDGTAEAGFYLNDTNLTLAYQFTLNSPDTLKAIQLYTDPIIYNTQENAQYQVAFNPIIWGDNNGLPGTIIYKTDTINYPIYEKGINTFHKYLIKGGAGVALNSGVFYVGYHQAICSPSSERPCNFSVGFDLNTDASDKTFIYTNSDKSWSKSITKGSLMLRPVFKKILSTGISVLNTSINNYQLFPNPAENSVYINSLLGNELVTVKFIDACGKMVCSRIMETKESINIESLSNGFYFVIIKGENSNSLISTQKLIIAR